MMLTRIVCLLGMFATCYGIQCYNCTQGMNCDWANPENIPKCEASMYCTSFLLKGFQARIFSCTPQENDGEAGGANNQCVNVERVVEAGMTVTQSCVCDTALCTCGCDGGNCDATKCRPSKTSGGTRNMGAILLAIIGSIVAAIFV